MKKILFSFFVSLPLWGAAQTETAIREHYTDVNKRIAESAEQGFEGSLYNNQWVVNRNGRSWPAVGIYTETTDLWYDDPPDHLPASERDPKTVLLKINISRRSSALLANEEYLFKDGKLLFYYSRQGEEDNLRETRLYFNSKGPFKSVVKANGRELNAADLTTEEYKDLKPNPAGIQSAAKKYQDLFVKTM